IKKGLYAFPRYEINVEGEERSNEITKRQFDSLGEGDMIDGYEASYGDFKTPLDKRYENVGGLVILIGLYSLTAMFASGFLQNASFITKSKQRMHLAQKLTTIFTF